MLSTHLNENIDHNVDIDYNTSSSNCGDGVIMINNYNKLWFFNRLLGSHRMLG